ncbi:hypothetical protein PVAG01_04349 [Phlyctema vagabunda]|uniref:Uncharacterized protein n=1 Tax=Phlyctema vagabunda TaxID=108571 RepID=A0ABR4PP05_9HELO
MMGSNEPLNVLDLPKIYQKPTYEDLKSVLEKLKVAPPTWTGKPSQPLVVGDSKAISGYLSLIISNGLNWFSNDGVNEDLAMERREEIWDDASRRIAERCGRSAMPEMTRDWQIPYEGHPDLSLTIREPPLTGDNLGFKTWGTAFTMSKELAPLKTQYLSHLFHDSQLPRVLELGSGTGLVGLAASAIWRCHVLLSDLPEICSNLARNIDENIEEIRTRGGDASCQALDWTLAPSNDSRYDFSLPELGENSSEIGFQSSQMHQVVIAADSLYDTQHPALVADMIANYQAPGKESRALVAVPLRDEHTQRLATHLRELLEQGGRFHVLAEGEWICFDDWESADQKDGDGVRCWWAVFGR